tara:strand:+ start:337 stop:495 length:159 start_codon:yes stop_codon:yes gene_type:complete
METFIEPAYKIPMFRLLEVLLVQCIELLALLTAKLNAFDSSGFEVKPGGLFK